MVCVRCLRRSDRSEAKRSGRLSGCTAAALALTALLSAVPARAEDGIPGIPDPSIATSLPSALGDPGGVRSALGRRGITFGVNYIGEVLGTVSGGVDRNGYYDGRLEVAIAADMEKLIGWRGLSFFANGYQIHGESISGESLGVLMPVSFIEANPGTRLFELWFEQRLLDDRLSVRFGQLAADSEFILSDGGGAFINGTFGWPSITAEAMPNGGPAYPLATPGVRVAFQPTDQLTLMAAVYNGDPAGSCESDDAQVCNKHGLNFRVSDPALTMFEGAYSYRLGGLPGTVKLGGWHNEGEFEGLLSGSILNNDHGLYAILDQMVYAFSGGDAPQGVSVFARVIGAPENRNLVDMYWEAGVTVTGMMASRPNDILGIGFAYTDISDDVRAAQVLNGDAVVMDYEAVLEVSYTAEIVPGFTIQPDFQYFWNPGGNVPDPDDPTGTTALKDAAVLGVRSTINY